MWNVFVSCFYVKACMRRLCVGSVTVTLLGPGTVRPLAARDSATVKPLRHWLWRHRRGTHKLAIRHAR